MKVITHRSLLAVVASIASLTIAAAAAPTAQAQSLNITAPGTYVLNRNVVVSSGDAITISASNVTLDLGGRTVLTTTPGSGRGIVVSNARGVVVRNGRIGPFNVNVQADNSENIVLEKLQIAGTNLPALGPGGSAPPPAEIGILLINSRAVTVSDNAISAVNLGIFVRGPQSGGNRIVDNVVTGGAVTERNLLGMCWNPAPGAGANDPGSRGDFVSRNHVSHFGTGISLSAGSVGNIVRDNTIAFITAAFSPATSAVNNVLENNTAVQIAP